MIPNDEAVIAEYADMIREMMRLNTQEDRIAKLRGKLRWHDQRRCTAKALEALADRNWKQKQASYTYRNGFEACLRTMYGYDIKLALEDAAWIVALDKPLGPRELERTAQLVERGTHGWHG